MGFADLFVTHCGCYSGRAVPLLHAIPSEFLHFPHSSCDSVCLLFDSQSGIVFMYQKVLIVPCSIYLLYLAIFVRLHVFGVESG